jgi:hypothetical protein
MPITLNQRILDLIYAGHSVAEVAALTGAHYSAITAAVADLSQTPSTFPSTLTGAAGTAGAGGATGPAGPAGPPAWTAAAAWTALTVGVVGPPATLVTRSGHTYVCVAPALAGVDPATDAGAHWAQLV